MKKLLVSAVIFGMMSTGVAFAAGSSQNNTGCGLGSMLLGEKANDSLGLQLLVTTTNGTFGNQTFGMTSGTSDCKTPSRIVENERLNEFVVSNIDSLAKDIAAGRGESLDTMAELMGISADRREAVYAQLQTNFSSIFTSERIETADVVDNIVSVINS
ncbi:MAG: DUF3015 family protein [Deltaproteobacteria bacterium]